VLPFRPLQVAAAHIFLNTHICQHQFAAQGRSSVSEPYWFAMGFITHKDEFFLLLSLSRFISVQYEKEKRIATVRYKVTWKGGENSLELNSKI
jgi:hypothetical protein